MNLDAEALSTRFDMERLPKMLYMLAFVLCALLSVAFAEDGLTDRDYDLRGRLVSEKDAENKTTAYRYDDRDRLIRTEYHDQSVMSVNYDDTTGTKTDTDAENRITTTDTDREGRVTRIVTPLNEKVFDYDGEGNKVLESDWFSVDTPRRDTTLD